MKPRKIASFFLIFLCGLFMLSSTGCGNSEGEITTYRTGSALKDDTSEKEEKQEESLYVVEQLNMAEETITLLSMESGRQLRYSYSLTTKFQDKYGESTSSMHFLPGLVVTIGEPLETGALSYVRMSDTVWRNDEVKKYSIDTEKGIFTIGKTKYRITDDTIIFSDDQEITWSDIGEDDVLRVVGMDRDVLSVSVTTGHGYIQLTNTGLFTDSLICVGDKIFTMITGDMTIEVPEGTYDITVANDGYGGTGTYTINRNETTIVDLDQLKGSGPKYCTLSFQVSVAGAAIYLDGTLVNANEPMTVAYGKHSLAVVAEGYETWQKTLVVNSASAIIALDLTDETDTTDTTDTSNTTTSTTSDEDTDEEDDDDDSSSSETSKKTDAEVDYLTTISDMISSMLSSD